MTMIRSYQSVVPRLCELSIGLILGAAGISKLVYPYSFLRNIYGYELLGADTGLLVAIVLPWIEVMVAFCLLRSILQSGAMAVALILSLVFVVAQTTAITRGLEISCGCFGGFVSGSTVNFSSLTYAASVGVLSVFGMWFRARDRNPVRSQPA